MMSASGLFFASVDGIEEAERAGGNVSHVVASSRQGVTGRQPTAPQLCVTPLRAVMTTTLEVIKDDGGAAF